MTGTIIQVMGKNQNCCRIRGENGTVYFAHKSEFPDPSVIREDQVVEFQPETLPRVRNVTAFSLRPQPEALSTR